LGFAGLQGIVLISAALMGRVEFWPVLAVVCLIAAAGAVLARKTRHATAQNPTQPPNHHPLATLLFWLLLAWAALHLALAAVEIFNRPVFPTDAWMVWVYRAKAWFYSGNVYQLASPANWLEGTATVPYAVDAYRYPSFASIIPFWAALSLGSWSETLVNTPVLLSGIALGCALYGQCRELGVSPLLSSVGVYLLLSIPLVGTHLSLAGYADIWMMGFAGLGFVALILGQTVNNRFQIVLGLGLIALGITVKDEGVVWFYAALLMLLLLTARPRWSLGILSLAAALLIIDYKTDIAILGIPVLGGLGISEGRIHVPFSGSYLLESYNVWAAYWISFFTLGSWNLLWPMLVLTVALLFTLRKVRLAQVIVIFLLIAAASQAFIFGFTEKGQWAAYFSAINRLPLHFTPALVFSLMAVFATCLGRSGSEVIKPRLWPYLLPAVAGTAIALLGLLIYLKFTTPTSQDHSVVFGPDKLAVVVGGGEVQNDTLTVNRYRDGYAIISSGEVSLDAGTLPLLHYEVDAEGGKSVDFIWRLATDASDIRRISLDAKGVGSISLANQPEWGGQIVEVGFAFYGGQDSPAHMRTLELAPPSLIGQLRVMWSDWIAPEPWTQGSINWLNGGLVRPLIAVPILLTFWLASTLLLYGTGWLLNRNTQAAVTGFAVCVLIAWILADMRWTQNQMIQAKDTEEFARENDDLDCIDSGDDCDIADLVHSVKQQLKGADDTPRVLIVPNQIGELFPALRAKYLLLPEASVVHKENLFSVPAHLNNYMLILKAKYHDSGDIQSIAAELAAKKSQTVVDLISEPEQGVLFKIGNSDDAVYP
jgi:hypothetical protein